MPNINVQKLKERILAEKERLQQDRNRLMNYGDESLAESVGEMVDFDLNHPGDSATETFERQKDIALNQNIDGMLGQVDSALAKIEAGTYGVCDRCGKDIPAARLEALPYATLCIDCQVRNEG